MSHATANEMIAANDLAPLTSEEAKFVKLRAGERIVRLGEVLTRTGLSRTTVYRREKEGRFPARIDLGGRLVGWYQSDIDQYVGNPARYRAAA